MSDRDVRITPAVATEIARIMARHLLEEMAEKDSRYAAELRRQIALENPHEMPVSNP
jgi:hypothetical protein